VVIPFTKVGDFFYTTSARPNEIKSTYINDDIAACIVDGLFVDGVQCAAVTSILSMPLYFQDIGFANSD
jgi:hypothetical protein